MIHFAFFAVTTSALYAVFQDGSIIRAVKLKRRPNVTCGVDVGIDLPGIGDYLAVTREHGLFFFQGHERTENTTLIRPEDVNTVCWQPFFTTDVVALFQDDVEANRCLHARTIDIYDMRWKAQTSAVLQIFDEHPYIRPSHHPRYGFPEDFFN